MPTSVLDNLLAASSASTGVVSNGNLAPGQRRTFDDALARAGETGPSEKKPAAERSFAPANTVDTEGSAAEPATGEVVVADESSEEVEREEDVAEQIVEVIAVVPDEVAIATESKLSTDGGDAELTAPTDGSVQNAIEAETDGDAFAPSRKQLSATQYEKHAAANENIAQAVQPVVHPEVPDAAQLGTEGGVASAEVSKERVANQADADEEVTVTDAALHGGDVGGVEPSPGVSTAATAAIQTTAKGQVAATAPSTAVVNGAAKLETTTAPQRRRATNEPTGETPTGKQSSANSVPVAPTVENSLAAIETVTPSLNESPTPPVEGDAAQSARMEASASAEKLPPPREPAVNAASRWSSLWNEKTSSASETKPQGNQSHVDAARFVQRVAKAFRAADDAGGPIRLRLSPPELGSLKVEVVLRGGSMFATLEAETTTARSLLVDNLPALRERLAEQNIKIERFDVDLKQDNQPGDNAANTAFAFDQQRDAQARQANSRGNKPRTAINPGNTTNTNNTETTSRTTAGRLNVVI